MGGRIDDRNRALNGSPCVICRTPLRAKKGHWACPKCDSRKLSKQRGKRKNKGGAQSTPSTFKNALDSARWRMILFFARILT
jgi:uncharacterized Zn finger protein (UPF0148 family)